jgi:transposase
MPLLVLTPAERAELERRRDTATKPHERERAAALLKVADGASPSQVARDGLLRRRRRGTVYEWIRRFRNEGLAALSIRKGRGRKPAFSPVYQQAEEAKEAILHVVRRDPHALGYDRSRWTLGMLCTQTAPFLKLSGDGSLSALFTRLGISYKRGRDYIHSPDPDYGPKLQRVDEIVAEVRASSGRLVALYQDELTYYRQPTVAAAYEAAGPEQPRALRSYRANTATRVGGALNVVDGGVSYRQGARFGVRELVGFYQQIRSEYPAAERIYVFQDNWPIHFHPDVLVALEEQENPWPWYRPRSWSLGPSAQAVKRWGALALPIQLVPLPTYASWTNPIEKLWRWLKQEVLHLHRLADQLALLRQEVTRFLEQFANGSPELLNYVGLPVSV